MTLPRVVAVIGAGEIGSGWAALFAAYGASVRIVDPMPAALERSRVSLEIARSIVARTAGNALGGASGGASGAATDAPLADVAGVSSHAAAADHSSITSLPLAQAVEGAEWIQESLPEDLDLKREVLAALQGRVAERVIVASSTSTFTASALARGLTFAPRVIVAHPLHPVYAVPIVELSDGARTDPGVIAQATEVLRAMGREPVVIRSEVPGLVANRLTSALLREALYLIDRGIVDAPTIDRIVSRGIATGWAAVGPLATEAIGHPSAQGVTTSERAWAEMVTRILEAAEPPATEAEPWSALRPPRGGPL